MYSPEKNITDINSISHNYVCGNKIYINDELTLENCSYLISDIHSAIEIPGNNLLEFFINSPGGRLDCMLSILTCMRLAKIRGLKISTYVTGEVGSAASLLAVCGDKRFMLEYAQHFVHFGCSPHLITKESEIKKANKEAVKFHQLCKEIYLKHTSIKEDKLKELMEDEYGYLTAKECLKYNFCDKII